MHNQKTAAVIGNAAAEALRREAAATPKPGLVDRENSGAHRDMDYPLFLASAAALKPYFVKCAALGMKYAMERSAGREAEGSQTADGNGADADANANLLKALREAGLAGEAAMFSATGGVNTHKGMVFSMGILCAALGQLTAEKTLHPGELRFGALQKLHPGTLRNLRLGDWGQSALQKLQRRCAELAAALLAENNPRDTHGAQVLRNTGSGGIRKEALSGFDSAFSLGYPAFKEARAGGLDENTALVKTLLILMTKTADSNAVYRGGTEGLAYLQQQAAEVLREGGFEESAAAEVTGEGSSRSGSTADGIADIDSGSITGSQRFFEAVRDFDRQCILRSLSPGGSADLLALSIMIYMIFETEIKL